MDCRPSSVSRSAPRRAAGLVLAALGAGCGRLSAPDGGQAVEPPGIVDAPGAPPTLPTLVSAFGGAGFVRVRCAPAAPPGLEYALFAANSAASVYAAAPIAVGVSDGYAWSGLADGGTWWLGLGVRATGANAWTPSGARLRAHVAAPLYVRAGADPAIADGLTPATAYPEPADALLWALVLGGANVWIAAGEYEQQSLPVFPGTYVVGGFDAAFDPATRDPALHPTRLRGVAGAAILACQGGGAGCVVDGLELDGAGVSSACIDALDTPLCVASSRLHDSADRGVRLRASPTNDPIDVRLCATTSGAHGADGVSVDGAFELRLDACVLSDNVQEGLDCADLVAPDGRTARLELRDCAARDNGTDGLDANLAAPASGGAAGGRFEVRLEHSRFERNGAEGAQVDVDYDAFPQWSSRVLVSGCQARANGQNGVHLDLDLNAEACVWRCVASANRGDGVLLSAETDPGFVFVAACALHGNLGRGLHGDSGQRALVASHCALAGNQGGGVASVAPASCAASCAAWEQPQPFDGVPALGCASSVASAAALFAHVPRSFGAVSAASGALLSSTLATTATVGQWAELSDDAQPRVVAQAGSAQLALLPAPAALELPAALVLWGDTLGVDEDFALAAASPALGAGLAMPGAPLVDAGPFGAAAAGELGALSVFDAEPFRPARATPAPGTALAAGSTQSLRVAFSGGELAAASASSASVRVIGPAGTELAVAIAVQAGELVLLAPPGGWPAGEKRVELYPGLGATSGAGLAAVAVLRYP